MLEELGGSGLSDAARRLGLDPFEVIRLLVVAEAVPADLRLTDDHLARLREVGGLEEWWEGVEAPEGAEPAVRAAVGVLLARLPDGATGRVENTWRALAPQDAAVVREAISRMLQEGWLAAGNTARGTEIAVVAEHREALTEVAEGKGAPPWLASLWTG